MVPNCLAPSQEVVWLANTEQTLAGGDPSVDVRAGTRQWSAAARDPRPVQEQVETLWKDLAEQKPAFAQQRAAVEQHDAKQQKLTARLAKCHWHTIAAEALKRAVIHRDDIWPSLHYQKLAGLQNARLTSFVTAANQNLQTEMLPQFFPIKGGWNNKQAESGISYQ